MACDYAAERLDSTANRRKTKWLIIIVFGHDNAHAREVFGTFGTLRARAREKSRPIQDGPTWMDMELTPVFYHEGGGDTMSNEELAVLIRTGERNKLTDLWVGVERFIWQQANRRAYVLNGYGGVTAEDLYQSGYFALLAAVDTYDPTAGMTFIGWLALRLKTAFAEAAGYRTQKRGADLLQRAISLDAPLSNDVENVTLADSIPDPVAEIKLETVIEQDRRQRLHAALEAAIEALPEAERFVLQSRCYQGRTLEEVAAERGISRERVRQIEARALRMLRHPMNNREIRKHL